MDGEIIRNSVGWFECSSAQILANPNPVLRFGKVQ